MSTGCTGIDSAVPLFHRVRMQHTGHLDAAARRFNFHLRPADIVINPGPYPRSSCRGGTSRPSRDKKIIAIESLVAFSRESSRPIRGMRDVRFGAVVKIIPFVALVNKRGNCAAGGESFHALSYI